MGRSARPRSENKLYTVMWAEVVDVGIRAAGALVEEDFVEEVLVLVAISNEAKSSVVDDSVDAAGAAFAVDGAAFAIDYRMLRVASATCGGARGFPCQYFGLRDVGVAARAAPGSPRTAVRMGVGALAPGRTAPRWSAGLQRWRTGPSGAFATAHRCPGSFDFARGRPTARRSPGAFHFGLSARRSPGAFHFANA